MSGIPAEVLLRVTKLRVTFRDDVGNQKIIEGTGFWAEHDGVSYFITNAHNVEPRMKLGSNTAFRLEKLEIALRRIIGSRFAAETKYFAVLDPKVRTHPTADVAILNAPEIEKKGESFGHISFEKGQFADENFLATSVNPMDVASFLGYPGMLGIPWYDQQWDMAIARTVNIASWPAIGFYNKAISTSDTMLVSGLSFSGSSGSPVLSHSKGINLSPESGLTGGGYVPPKIIGIMSGHWKDEGSPDAFRHSGLSYLTRSTAILCLLAITPAPSP